MCGLDVKADEKSIDKIEKLIVFFQCFQNFAQYSQTQKEKTSNRCSSATPLDIIQVSMFIDFLMVFARTCNQQTSFSMVLSFVFKPCANTFFEQELLFREHNIPSIKSFSIRWRQIETRKEQENSSPAFPEPITSKTP